MPLLSSRNLERRRRADPKCPALRFFGCFSMREAHASALDIIGAADRCARCHDTLLECPIVYYDEDPRALIERIDPSHRDACTLRLLAAWIIVHGKDRSAAA